MSNRNITCAGSGTTTPPPTTPTPSNPASGCNFSQGQLLLNFYGEAIYAHQYNGVWYAAYQDGSNFKPRHWLVAAGYDPSRTNCFATEDPRNGTTNPNPPANPNPPTNPNPPSTGGSLAFQIISYDCNSGVLRYQFSSSANSPVTVSMPGIFAGTVNPNTVASYTFPSDGRTGRTITGSANQSGAQITINFTTGCSISTNPNPSTNPTPTVPTNGCGSGTGLIGLYFNNDDLSGNPVFVRTDPSINFSWSSSSPQPGIINADVFSVHWTGFIEAPVNGQYTFKTNNDDGTHLWVNGQKLINDWNGHPATWKQGSIHLNAGQRYEIRIDFGDFGGDAQSQLYWEYPGQDLQIIPSCRFYPIGSTMENGNSYRFQIDEETVWTDQSGRVINSTFSSPKPRNWGSTKCPGLKTPKMPRAPKPSSPQDGGNECDQDGGPSAPPSEPIPVPDPQDPNSPQNPNNPIEGGSGSSNGNGGISIPNGVRIPTTAYLDRVDCKEIYGWAFATNGGYANLDIYVNGNKVATITANNDSRPDVRTSYGGDTKIPLNCGFKWTIPDALKSTYGAGETITINIVPVNDMKSITNSPKTTSTRCMKPGTETNPNPTGPFEPFASGILLEKPIEDYTTLELATATNRIFGHLGISSYDQLEQPDFPPIINLNGLLLLKQVSREYYILKQIHSDWSGSKLLVQSYKNVYSGKIHFLLDAFGLVPGAGEISDAINGGIYLLEGDNTNAALSFAAMMPIGGWAATGGKWARNGLQFVGEGIYKSTEGLIWSSRKYARDKESLHALNHTYLHFKNDLNKKLHGVFTVPSNELISLTDEAWTKIKNNHPGIIVTNDGSTIYKVPMRRAIGYQGGNQGNGAPLDHLTIIFDSNNPRHVITAFPE